MLLEAGAPPLQDSKAQKNLKGKKVPQPPKPKVNERKIPKRFILTVLRDGYYEPMSEVEFDDFKRENPELALYFEDEEAI